MTLAPGPPLALVVALAVERRALQPLLTAPHRTRLEGCHLVLGRRAGRSIVLVQAGLGPERSRAAARLACRRFGCRALWSAGLAGGLAAVLGPGDLVVPTAVLVERGETTRPFTPGPDPTGLERLVPASVAGPLLSLRRPLLTPAEKQAWHRRTGAVAVDMEAAGVGEASAELGLPWLALKAVLDPADQDVPAFLAAGTSAQGNVAWSRLVPALRSPARLRAAFALARASRVALAALAQGVMAALDAGVALTPPEPSGKICD